MQGHLPLGSEFLFGETPSSDIFSPEDFSSEQRQIAATTEEFVRREILPHLDLIENQNFPLVVEKMRQCAELGLFLVDIPEEFGGLDLDKGTSMLLAEKMAPAGSFAITFAGQTGIASLPLVYYGTSDQKTRYLEKLTSGEWIGAYCLTEPDSGSDPLSARTTATLTDDGRCYVLNGVKQFITNAAFADLFTVFAKIDDKHFSAFLVERGFPGLSIGPEEKKMGLKGSSTAQVILQEVRVPVANLLGEPGKGHKIAFNVLNIGRLKLAATVIGMAKAALAEGAAYAQERKQFGRVIAEFGAIREKLADLTAALFSAESVVYRVAGLLDRRLSFLDRTGADYFERYQRAIEEYAGECAMAKVFCTDMLALVVDEVLQIHGGYGYVSDYPIERFYRDERINRIFEGTNEINRLLIPTLLLRRAETGSLPLRERVGAAPEQVRSGPGPGRTGAGPFAAEFSLLADLKTSFFAVLGAAEPVKDAQEVLLALADQIIGIFVLEGVLLRADKAYPAAGDSRRTLLRALVTVTTFERTARFQLAASRCCAYALPGDAALALGGALAHLAAYRADGLLQAKHLLAEAACHSAGYPF